MPFPISFLLYLLLKIIRENVPVNIKLILTLFTVKFYAKVHFYHLDFKNGQRLSDAYLEHISFS